MTLKTWRDELMVKIMYCCSSKQTKISSQHSCWQLSITYDTSSRKAVTFSGSVGTYPRTQSYSHQSKVKINVCMFVEPNVVRLVFKMDSKALPEKPKTLQNY